MGRKYNHEFVVNYFEEHGCKLITKFEHVKTQLEYICKCGKKETTTFDSFRRSKYKKCKSCISRENNANSTLNINIVRDFFKEKGCVLLDNEYVNSKTKMKYICKCGEIDYKDWNKFRNGQRCRKCGIKKNAERQRTDFDEIKQFFKEHGCQVLDDNVYLNVHTPIKHICSCGEIVTKSWIAFKSSPQCTCDYNYSKPLKRKFTKQDLIDAFWEFHNEYGRYPLTTDLNSNPNYPSQSSYERNFGGYTNFLNEIGVLGDGGWYKCDENVLKEIYQTESYETINNALMVKKSWGTIIAKANSLGLKRKKEYTSEELINLIEKFQKEKGRIPNKKDFDSSSELPNGRILTGRFGSWNNALRKAGFKVKDNVKLTDDDIKHIISKYTKGELVIHIADNYGITPNRVNYILRENNVPTKTNQWTPLQLDLLKTHYATMEWDELLRTLHPFRKEDITTKAYMLGIKRECYGYSEEEIEILRNNYGKVSFEEIQKMLPNKTVGSIATKASKLGLVMREKWSDEEVNKLKELYPYYTNQELVDFFPNRTSTSISSMGTMYFNLRKDPSIRERIKEETKELLMSKLKRLAEKLGRTPTGDEVLDCEEIPSLSSYVRHFGSYSDACREVGLDPNISIFGKSYHYISDNGDLCLSSKELEITNILIANKIDYEKEILYKEIIGDENLPLIRSDWLIGDVVIEYFGMPEKESYRERMNMKIQLCKDNNIKLISLLPNDLTNNYQGMLGKFDEYDINLKIPVS